MHRENNMIGEIITANYNVSLVRRYVHRSRHKQPGRIMRKVVGFVTALEVKVGVLLYA